MADLTEIENAWCDWQETLGAREREVYRQSLVPFKAGAVRVRARIRRELLEEFGEPGSIEWRQFMKVLDRICPEED